MAGGRFGKTTLALWKLLNNAGQGRTPCWYIAPTYRQAKQIAWLKLLSMVPPKVIKRKNETELFIELINNRRVELKGADNEDTLRGVPLGAVVFDETPFIKEHVWGEIIYPRTVDYKAPVWFIGTPSLGKDWFYKLYLKGQNPENKEWRSFHYTILDNPYLDPIEVDNLRKGMNPLLWRQECLAEPTGISGLCIPSFEHSYHVVKSFNIPDNWRRGRGADWGMANPTCCLWGAEHPDTGDIYIYKEHYQSGWTAMKQALTIKVAERRSDYVFTVMDPSAFKRERDGMSVADDFNRNGVVVQPADNNVERGLSLVNKFFSDKPSCFIFENCYNTIDEISTYVYEPTHGEKDRREQPRKVKDHAMDALRYLLMEFDRRIKRVPHLMTPVEFRRKVDEETAATQRLPLRRSNRNGLVLNSEGYING